MARAEANKLYTNFSKGLVTEASHLAYPENASIDERNCDILNNGYRSRRYGLDSIEASTEFEKVVLGLSSGVHQRKAYSHLWKNAGNNPTSEFLVLFCEGVVHFYNIIGVETEEPVYSKHPETIDLSFYKLSTATEEDVDENIVAFTHGKGCLFITNKYIDPLRIDYDAPDNSFSTHIINIKVRDHYGLDDDLTVDEEPATLSVKHHYNLLNQGWKSPVNTGTGQTLSGIGLRYDAFRDYTFPIYSGGTTPVGPIKEYFDAIGRYPSNSKVWWAGKDAEGDFDPTLLTKTYFGNTRAPRGHFVIDAFSKDRTAVSGIAGLPSEARLTRPDAICFASGRVFYGHESTVYMSPVLESPERAGDCFQEADPTSEDISDLIPSDGGFIEVPDANNIISLKPLADGIVVVATNGVWFINSGSQGFTALDYSLHLITEIGCNARESVVTAGDSLYYWSKSGIQSVSPASGQYGMIPGQFTKQNISDFTIKRFYNEINEFTRTETKGQYDPATNCIFWLYRNDDTRKRFVLQLNLNYIAFVPFEIDCEGETLIDLFVDQYYTDGTLEPTFIKFVSMQKQWSPDPDNYYQDYLNLSQFTNREYLDGQYADTEGRDPNPTANELFSTYSSYIETGYEVMQDALRKKQIPFLGVFFERTEEVLDENTSSAVLAYPSSCFMVVKWSWSGRESSNRWSTPIQAYRPVSSPFFVPTTSSARADYDVVYSRNKIRGSGRAIQFRFYEDRQGYGFTLIGWHSFFQGNTVP